jgi:Holliday junction DNA helicase RuvA
MIGKLTGELIALKPPSIMVEVSGVGYEIDLPMSDCAEIGPIGGAVILYTHLVIREDAHLLYGFLTVSSRDCFRQLIKVSGIGPKIALALLSTLSVEQISLAVESGNAAILTKTPGIGNKVAERLLLELKGKQLGRVDGVNVQSFNNQHAIYADIANALNSLGYADKEINHVMRDLPTDMVDLSSGIKAALKLLGKHN